jgi:hypothetical protein
MLDPSLSGESRARLGRISRDVSKGRSAVEIFEGSLSLQAGAGHVGQIADAGMPAFERVLGEPTLQDALRELGHGAPPGPGLRTAASAGAEGLGLRRLLEPDLPAEADGAILLMNTGDTPEEQEIVVTGTRPKTPKAFDPGNGQYEGGGTGGSGMSGEGGTGESTGEPVLDCADRNALEAKDEIKSHSDDQRREHGSFVYRGADGKVHHTSPFHGDGERLTGEDLINAMKANGISFSQLLGFVHNHDAWMYGTSDSEAAVNRYPSDNDWNAADWMVRNGAGGVGGAAFSLYLIDTSGVLREFDYEDKQVYTSLSKTDKEKGKELPEEMKSDGSTC